jgi:hypothetical protein
MKEDGVVTSPMVEIERAVLARAKRDALDVDDGRGRIALRALVEGEVAAWQDGFRRGSRPFELADAPGVVERAFRNLAGYGPLEPLLADDDVWEIMVNAPDGAIG